MLTYQADNSKNDFLWCGPYELFRAVKDHAYVYSHMIVTDYHSWSYS